MLVRARWHDLVEGGQLAADDASSTATVTVRWVAIGAVVLLLAASYLAITAG